MEKGKLVVLDGACDGIGKTTQSDLLCKRLENDGEQIFKHHFPSYGTPQGEKVEKYLRGEYGKPSDLDPYFINSLYAYDRNITWHTVLKPQYELGKIILLDRYTTSSLIYQSALIEDLNKKKKFIDDVIHYEYEELGIKAPDKVIFLYAPYYLVTEMRKARKQNEGVTNDIHERDNSFMEKVYDSAMFVADYLSWDKVQCNNGNEMRDIEDIHEEVYSLIKKNR